LHYLRVFLFTIPLINLAHVSASASGEPSSEQKLTPVRVQLKWFHQFQSAGFYAAIEKGYFKQLGLDVELIEGGPKIDPTLVVTRGDAEFGVGNSTLLIDYNNGRPVVAVSAIFQHSPFIILARRNRDMRTVKDLEGHTLMRESHAAELTAYLKLAGVEIDKVKMVPHTGTVSNLAKDSPDRVDAMTAYTSYEPYFATKKNIPYKIFNPRDIDIDFYADTLFASRDLTINHPKVVDSMRDALAKGWQYARANQDEIISLILRDYHSNKKMDRLSLNSEAQVVLGLLDAEIVEIGYMSLSRWQHIGDVFAKAGELQPNYTLDGFLYETDEQLPLWVFMALLATSILVAIGVFVSIYVINLNKKLTNSLAIVAERTAQLEAANNDLRELSNTDALTGVANRRYFTEAINDEFLRAKRNREPLALLMIDADYFKMFNDYYGHQAGDNCLIEIARIIDDSVQRAGDLVARYGGEEFAVILPNMNSEKAIQLANKICRTLADKAIQHVKSSYSVITISIGVYSCIPEKEMPVEELIRNTDLALYRAKNAGKNTVIAYSPESDQPQR